MGSDDGGYVYDDGDDEELQTGDEYDPPEPSIGEGTDEPEPALPGDGWPAGVGVDPVWWERHPESPTGWGYRVHPGFTFSGWARTYLKLPERWKELWNYQPAQWRYTHKPDAVAVGTLLRVHPAGVVAGEQLGAIPAGTEPTGGTASKRGALVLAGVGALAIVGGAVYLLRKKR